METTSTTPDPQADPAGGNTIAAAPLDIRLDQPVGDEVWINGRRYQHAVGEPAKRAPRVGDMVRVDSEPRRYGIVGAISKVEAVDGAEVYFVVAGRGYYLGFGHVTVVTYDNATQRWHAVTDTEAPSCDEPHLGLATTRQLLDEISARIEVHGPGLDYRTVER